MTKDQFNLLKEINSKPICESDLVAGDRTLLYGYTCSRETFHVYLKNGKIHVVVYDTSYANGNHIILNMREIVVIDNMDYVPDKRLYPSKCDYEFCKLLIQRGISLPFTCMDENDDNDNALFFGAVLEDFM